MDSPGALVFSPLRNEEKKSEKTCEKKSEENCW